MSIPLRREDPAYFLLEQGRREARETPDQFQHRSKPTIFRADCYICRDPEFALMGMPLCFPCHACGGHVPADEYICDDCGHEIQPDCDGCNPEPPKVIEGEVVADGGQ